MSSERAVRSLEIDKICKNANRAVDGPAERTLRKGAQGSLKRTAKPPTKQRLKKKKGPLGSVVVTRPEATEGLPGKPND